MKFDIDENYDEFTNDMIDFWDEVGKGKDNPFYSVSARDFYENHIDEFIDMAYERDYDKLAKYLGQIDDDLASFSSNTKVQKNISDYKNAMVLRDKAQAEYDKPENQKLVEEINRFHKAYPADRPPLGGKQGNEAFTKMGIKTAISRALDKGYDRVAWTPVENQVKIYGEIGERSRGLYKSIYEKAMPRDVKAIAKELGVNPDDILKKTKMQFPDDFGGVQEVWYIDLKPIKDKLINKKGNVVQKAYSATPAVPFGLLGMQEEEKGRMNPNKGLLQ